MRGLTALGIALALAVGGCASDEGSPYAENYKPLTTPTRTVQYAGEPQLRSSLGSAADDTLAMFTLGYANVGWASFQGANADPSGALEQARQIGAAFVIISRDPAADGALAVPTGPVNPSGLDARAGFAQRTHLDPTRNYAQAALFFAPLPKEGAGIFYRDLTPPEAKALGRSGGVAIAAVRQGSPAALAGLQPGDVIETAESRKIANAAALRALGPLKSRACLGLAQGSQRRSVCLKPPLGWS